ncbi:MAG: hypothetical protein PHQ46_08575, partial [Negativicutes bacterium]|nr:hypothetical protein [Negativicutes bacterium]
NHRFIYPRAMGRGFIHWSNLSFPAILMPGFLFGFTALGNITLSVWFSERVSYLPDSQFAGFVTHVTLIFFHGCVWEPQHVPAEGLPFKLISINYKLNFKTSREAGGKGGGSINHR